MKTKLFAVLFISLLATISGLGWGVSAINDAHQAGLNLAEADPASDEETMTLLEAPVTAAASAAPQCKWSNHPQCPDGNNCGYALINGCCIAQCRSCLSVCI